MSIHAEEKHLAIVREILRRMLPKHSKVWAFGSRATGNRLKRFSDLDLAIDAGRPLTLTEEGRMKGEFSESLLPWKVDIVDMQTVGDSFRPIVDQQKVVLEL